MESVLQVQVLPPRGNAELSVKSLVGSGVQSRGLSGVPCGPL